MLECAFLLEMTKNKKPRPAAPEAFHLPIKTFTLANGLVVIVQTDRTVPVVAVSITYKVGSQNENPGKSGFAHLFEHLMFQGTKNLKPNDIAKLIENNGGVNNAYTMKTNTTYHEIIPRSALPTILWAEADRMHRLLVDERSLGIEKQVVMEEKRQSELNKPYRQTMDEGIANAAFLKWSNRHTTIGEMQDLKNATLEDVREFYFAHYAPNNAVLALAGEIDEKEARELTGRYFANIPARDIPPTPDLSESPLKGETLKTVKDPLAKMPLTTVSWHAPKRGTKDFWALSLLMNTLSNSDESPLYQALVKKSKVALSAQGYMPHWSSHYNMKGPDVFTFSVSGKAGVAAGGITAELDKVLARFARKGPSASELERAKTETEREWLDEMQFLMDRAQILSSYAALIGPPAGLRRDLRNIFSVTAGDVAKAVKTWIIGKGRVIMHVEPGEPAPPAPEEAAPAVPAERPRAPGEVPPAPDRARPVPIPEIGRFTLKNGLPVVFVKDARLPLIELRLSLRASPADEGRGQDGLSHALDNLFFKGTAEKSGEAIARAISRLGFEVSTQDDSEFLRISAAGLSRNAEAFLRELSSVLRGANYPEAETSLWKENMLEELLAMRGDSSFLTEERMKKELFEGHPYGRGIPNEKSINAVSGKRLREFHASRVTPDQAKLVIVGNLGIAEAERMLERALGQWIGSAPEKHTPPMPGNKPSRISLVDRPGSSQASLTVAQTAPLTPKNPDWLPFLVMNHILGGTENSRLFENLRTDKGYTYGSYCGIEAFAQGIAWSARAEVRNDVAGPSIEEIFKEVRFMKANKVSPETLAAAKRYMSGLFLLKMAALNRTANYLSALTEDGRDPAYEMGSYLKRLESVTSEQVEQAAQKYLDPEKMVTVVVGDAKALKGRLPR